MIIKEPLLATTLKDSDRTKLQLPLYGSEKLDGLRLLVMPSEPYLLPRSGKRFENVRLMTHFKELIDYCKAEKVVLDGEMFSRKISFQQLVSYKSTHDKPILEEDEVEFHCFDALFESEWDNNSEPPFNIRHRRYKSLTSLKRFVPVEQRLFSNWEDIDAYYDEIIEAGGEGVMLRSPTGRYKHGRSTVREGILLKLKAFETKDAYVVDYEPLYRNIGEREIDVFGRSKTTTRGGDREAIAALGTLVVRTEDGIEFRIGSGFNFRGGDKDRTKLWNERDSLKGRWLEFQYMKCGQKDKPRIPTFVRWREDKK